MLGFKNNGKPLVFSAESLDAACELLKQQYSGDGKRLNIQSEQFRGPVSPSRFDWLVQNEYLTKEGRKTKKWWDEIGI